MAALPTHTRSHQHIVLLKTKERHNTSIQPTKTLHDIHIEKEKLKEIAKTLKEENERLNEKLRHQREQKEEDEQEEEDYRLNRIQSEKNGITLQENEVHKLSPKRAQTVHSLRTQSSRNWSKVRNVIKVISLMQNQEVTEVKDSEQLNQQLRTHLRGHDSHPDRTSVISTGAINGPVPPDDDAFQQFDRVHALMSCCEAGGEANFAKALKILQNDPKKNLRSVDDPEHLVNKKDSGGLFPLYAASRNGNLEFVRLLLRVRANPYQEYQLGKKSIQSIEAALGWGHHAVLQLFLEQVKYPTTYLKRLLTKCTTPRLKALLQKQILAQGGSKKSSLFSCLCIR